MYPHFDRPDGRVQDAGDLRVRLVSPVAKEKGLLLMVRELSQAPKDIQALHPVQQIGILVGFLSPAADQFVGCTTRGDPERFAAGDHPHPRLRVPGTAGSVPPGAHDRLLSSVLGRVLIKDAAGLAHGNAAKPAPVPVAARGIGKADPARTIFRDFMAINETS